MVYNNIACGENLHTCDRNLEAEGLQSTLRKNVPLPFVFLSCRHHADSYWYFPYFGKSIVEMRTQENKIEAKEEKEHLLDKKILFHFDGVFQSLKESFPP